MRPIIRKEDSENTLAYDLTKQPPKMEKTQKKMIKDPYTIQLERKGRKEVQQANLEEKMEKQKKIEKFNNFQKENESLMENKKRKNSGLNYYDKI